MKYIEESVALKKVCALNQYNLPHTSNEIWTLIQVDIQS